MTVQINRKKLYYNYYTSGKFLTLKFKFEVKSFDIPSPPPQTSDALLRPWWLYFETDFSFKISLVCSSKWIHDITYSLILIFWHEVCDVIYPPNSSSSKNKKNIGPICKNDMFYVHGIFSTNGIKIKEIEAYWRFCMHFWQACMQRNLQQIPGDTLGNTDTWGWCSLGYQLIALIQEIAALHEHVQDSEYAEWWTTTTCW
jgi:hypothetical protein